MSLEAITLVIEPSRVDVGALFPNRGIETSDREFYRYEQFAIELQKHTSVPVSVVDAFLRNAPDKGMLLVQPSSYEMVDELPDDRRQEILRRVVLMQPDAGLVLTNLERFGCAGAVAKRHYMDWLMNSDESLRIGLYGLRSIGAELGAECSAAFASEHYCYLTSDRFDDLPSLVVGYLEAVAR